MDSKKTANILAAFIVVLACTQMFGYIIGSRDIRMFGQALMFAPFPVPFSAIQGYDSITSSRMYTLTFSDGHSEAAELDPILNEIIRGPHRRKIPYLQIFRFAPVYKRDTVERFLRFTLCTGDVFDRYTSKVEDLDHITLTIRTASSSPTIREWKYSASCI